MELVKHVLHATTNMANNSHTTNTINTLDLAPFLHLQAHALYDRYECASNLPVNAKGVSSTQNLLPSYLNTRWVRDEIP